MFSIILFFGAVWGLTGMMVYAVNKGIRYRSRRWPTNPSITVNSFKLPTYAVYALYVAAGPASLWIEKNLDDNTKLHICFGNQQARIKRKKRELKRQVGEIPPSCLTDDELSMLIDNLDEDEDDELEKIPSNTTAITSAYTAGYRDFPQDTHHDTEPVKGPPYDMHGDSMRDLKSNSYVIASKGDVGVVKAYRLNACPECGSHNIYITEDGDVKPGMFLVAAGQQLFCEVPNVEHTTWIPWSDHRNRMHCHQCGVIWQYTLLDCVKGHVLFDYVDKDKSPWETHALVEVDFDDESFTFEDGYKDAPIDCDDVIGRCRKLYGDGFTLSEIRDVIGTYAENDVGEVKDESPEHEEYVKNQDSRVQLPKDDEEFVEWCLEETHPSVDKSAIREVMEPNKNS